MCLLRALRFPLRRCTLHAQPQTLLTVFHKQRIAGVYPAPHYVYDAYIDSGNRVSVLDFDPLSRFADLGLYTAEVRDTHTHAHTHKRAHIHWRIWLAAVNWLPRCPPEVPPSPRAHAARACTRALLSSACALRVSSTRINSFRTRLALESTTDVIRCVFVSHS